MVACGGVWHAACGSMWPIFIFGIGIFRAHIFKSFFLFSFFFFVFIAHLPFFLALTEMERTFPENVVPGWLWSLCAVQRGAIQELCVCEGGAGAQDVNHDHLTSLWLIDFRLCLFLSVLRSVLVCVCVYECVCAWACVCGAQEMLRTMQLKIRFN